MKLEADGILPASVIVTFAEKLRVTCEYPGLPEIRCAAILANKGLLGSVIHLRLKDVDLSSVPAQNLASLVACVTGQVDIENVTGGAVVNIL